MKPDTSDLNALFACAEESFRAGRHDAARADILTLARLTGPHPRVLLLLGLVEKARGDLPAAVIALTKAAALDQCNPDILNNLGNVQSELGLIEQAITSYTRAIAAKSGKARLNRAITLHHAGRHEESRADFTIVLRANPSLAHGWSALGAMERDAGDLAAAAAAYDQALIARINHPIALHGRARVALERGEEDAVVRYTKVAQLLPDDPDVVIGEAEARESAGLANAATRLAERIACVPDWVEGHALLARMRWEAGDEIGFTMALDQALLVQPVNANLHRARITALAGADRFVEATEAARTARQACPNDAEFLLREAVHAGEAGDHARAEHCFRQLPPSFPGRPFHEARHLLRRGAIDQAAMLLDAARNGDPSDVAIWALTGIVWRLNDDPRLEWLYRPSELIATCDLQFEDNQLMETAALLRMLHRTRRHPLHQSLRGGTQTRGSLLDRIEPLIVDLTAAIRSAVNAYWAKLPPADDMHPLLRHREKTPRIIGSWSVRLTQSGFHVAHIHSNGVISSACYFALPDTANAPTHAGWLELGRPPDDLQLALPPLQLVEPKIGTLALFPSTLHHGTRPFPAGERITVAFDVAATR